MKKKIIIIYLPIIFLLLSSCGFKKINSDSKNSYGINNIVVIGDNRIGYILKNEITLNSSTSATTLLDIEINLEKEKNIKEKNISGNATKYNLIFSADFSALNIKNSKKIIKKFTRSSDFTVKSSHSDTLKDEKKTTLTLAEQISEDIVNFLKMNFQL
tara:strand:- start:456 stop:929 length:474 start_codon:yes stop_codon:yes gene_type:complete